MDQRFVDGPPSHDSGLSQPPFDELVLDDTTWLCTRTLLARPSGPDSRRPDLSVTKVRENPGQPPICLASVDQVGPHDAEGELLLRAGQIWPQEAEELANLLSILLTLLPLCYLKNNGLSQWAVTMITRYPSPVPPEYPSRSADGLSCRHWQQHRRRPSLPFNLHPHHPSPSTIISPT